MNIRTTIMVLMMISLIGLLTACASEAKGNALTDNAVAGPSVSGTTVAIDKLEIYHFHGTNQCHSCVTVGAYAEETVTAYFKDELESGKIVFGHINGDLPVNSGLVAKYGATGSSLWLGTYAGDEFTPEQNVNVWYKIDDKQAYMEYLKGVIEQKLAGN